MKTFGQMEHYLPQYTCISGSSLLDLVKDRDAKIMPEPNITKTDLSQTDQVTAYFHYHNNNSSSCRNVIPYSQFMGLPRLCSETDDFSAKNEECADFSMVKVTLCQLFHLL